MRSHCVLLYRGPLERSRLSFIIDSLLLVYSGIDLVWIAPKYDDTRAKYFEDFTRGYKIDSIHVLDHTARQFFKTVAALKEIFKTAAVHDLAMVGFSSVYFSFASRAKKKYWFINGIPEEKQMQSNRLVYSLGIRIQWLISKWLLKPDLIVTVSNRMSKLVKVYFPRTEIFSAPTCVDTTTFFMHDNKPKDKKLFVYLGSGAAWQAIDLLSMLWGCIHAADPSISFRVISRDERCKELGRSVASTNIEFVSANTFEGVAKYLNQAQVGFLVRRPHIVNEVSFPTKLGEYIASGLWVVTSDLDWDVADFVREHQIGHLVAPQFDAKAEAIKVLSAYQRALQDKTLSERLEAARIEMDRANWANSLRLKLTEVRSRMD